MLPMSFIYIQGTFENFEFQVFEIVCSEFHYTPNTPTPLSILLSVYPSLVIVVPLIFVRFVEFSYAAFYLGTEKLYTKYLFGLE